jgi:hypothetical protein
MTNITTDQRAKVYETWLKCLRLSNDSATTPHEREAAHLKSLELRAKLDAMGGETKPAADPARYRALVKQGKALLEEQDNVNWKLGELASQVDKEYGQDKLKEFADELGVSTSSLKDCRTTYIAWPEKARRPAFSIARALNPHPRKFEIVEKKPDITFREAREKMQEYREREAARAAKFAKKSNGTSRAVTSEPDADDTPEQTWQRSLSNAAGEAVALRAYWTRIFGDWQKFKAPSDLVTLAKQAATAWVELAADLSKSSAVKSAADRAETKSRMH